MSDLFDIYNQAGKFSSTVNVLRFYEENNDSPPPQQVEVAASPNDEENETSSSHQAPQQTLQTMTSMVLKSFQEGDCGVKYFTRTTAPLINSFFKYVEECDQQVEDCNFYVEGSALPLDVNSTPLSNGFEPGQIIFVEGKVS